MPRQLSLGDVKKILEKGKVDTGLLKDMDAIMGLAVLLAPAAVGLAPVTVAVIVAVLSKREALIKAGQAILDHLKGHGAGDEVAQLQRLESAHVLITYTAFFDSVSEMVPEAWEGLARAVEIQPATEETVPGGLVKRAQRAELSAQVGDSVTELPHPVETIEERQKRLHRFYEFMTIALVKLLETFKIFSADARNVFATLRDLPEDLIQNSIYRYEAQYVELAKSFPEFYIWTELRHKQAVDSALRSIDIGFESLKKTIEEIRTREATETMQSLLRQYEHNLNRPILDLETEELSSPTRQEIFIPQQFRALRARQKESLESEGRWKDLSSRSDLGPFLLSCLKSPYTETRPILILGQPGSGKSLLTTALSAQIGADFDVIRVELRNVEADAEIHSQIVEAVERDTQGAIVSWPQLRKVLTRTPVIVFDGYDELLQATGRTHANYLRKLADFQENEKAQDRPVRVIVTSRITLIDSAQLPGDVTVVRLEPFDSERQKKWIEVWNGKNEAFFNDPSKKTGPFELPRDSQIRELARQPVLLMMLALYDSEENKLGLSKQLSRTRLYDNLIRDFVRREKTKDPEFLDLASDAASEQIDAEVKKLAVAAVGMLNRNAFSLSAPDLDADLKAFNLAKAPMQDDRRSLGERGLFGRFFFVVKSETSARTLSEMSYEFLHATFGEFLAADLLASQITDTCYTLALAPSADREDYLRNPHHLQRRWFEGLMKAPLMFRPVVVDMFAEWLPQKAGDLRKDKVLRTFDQLVRAHLTMILDGKALPSHFDQLPLVGHAAIYSLNLVILRAALSNFSLEDSALSEQTNVARGWDRLTHLWRSWFTFDALSTLSELISARRQGAKIEVRRESIHVGATKLERVSTLARALADNTLAGLSCYFIRNAYATEMDVIEQYLRSEEIDIHPYIQFRKLDVPVTDENRAAYVDFIRGWDGLATSDLWRKAVSILASDPDSGVQWVTFPTVREMRSSTLPLIRPALTFADTREFSYYGRSVSKDGLERQTESQLIEAAEEAMRTEDAGFAEDVYSRLSEIQEERDVKYVGSKEPDPAWTERSGTFPLRNTFLRLALFLGKTEDLSRLVRTPRLDNVESIIEELGAVIALGSDPAGLHGILPDIFPKLNISQPKFAHLMRKYKQLPSLTDSDIAQTLQALADAEDLSADVIIAILDLVPAMKSPFGDDVRKGILMQYSHHFPADKVAEISLDLLPAARRVLPLLLNVGVDDKFDELLSS
jgi:AAA domain